MQIVLGVIVKIFVIGQEDFIQDVAIVKVKEVLKGQQNLNDNIYKAIAEIPVSTAGSIMCRPKAQETTTNHPWMGVPCKISQHVFILMLGKV